MLLNLALKCGGLDMHSVNRRLVILQCKISTYCKSKAFENVFYTLDFKQAAQGEIAHHKHF